MRPFISREKKIPVDSLKKLASIYESLGSQFLKTSSGIHSRPVKRVNEWVKCHD